MRVALFILSLLFVSPASATVKISDMDPGGSVSTYINYWTRVGQSGEQVIIDAPCMSACTFFLGLVPAKNVCMTPRASLGVHQVSSGDVPDPVFSAAFYRWIYPEWVQQWIKDHGGLQPDVMFMYPEDTKGHIPLCPGYEYDTVSPADLIHQEQPN